MKLTRVIAISVIAASLGLGVVNAQSFSPMDAPAEFPPASYKGKQYVDSRGCVYIRAGVDGAVTWVPRVTRDRKVICGFKPTLPKGTAGVAPAPKMDKNVVQIQPAAKPTEQPSIFGTPKPAPKPATTTSTAATKPAPKPAPKATAAAKPAPKPAPKPTATAAPKPAPKPQTTTVRTTTAKPAPKAAPPRTTATGQPLYTTPTAQKPKAKAVAPATTTTAPRRTTTQQPRSAGSLSPCRSGATTYKGMAVRCGPQSESPVTPGRGGPTAPPPKIQFDRQSALTPGTANRGVVGQVVREGEVHPQTRVVPRHVYENNLVTHVSAAVPPGYRRVFDDGRLNPRRAEMTFAGKAQSDSIWTRKTPRQLIHRRTGEVVVVSSKSSSSSAPFEPEPTPMPVATSTPAPAPTPVVSTRSASAEKALRLAGTPYVQIGTYGTGEAAQSVAQSVQRMGLPVRIGKYQRNGATQRIVLAGPFGSVGAAEQALNDSRKAGFPDAFLRQ